MEFISAGSSILGGLLGGVFRVVPEIFKFLDAKNDRAHELAMQDKQLEFFKIQGQQKVDEARVYQEAVDVQALSDVLVAQAKPTGNWLVDFLNALVRPLITYVLLCLYIAVKYTTGMALHSQGIDALTIAKTLYTPDDQALFWGIVNFWFLDRVIKAKQK
jgi:hypothetical protein